MSPFVFDGFETFYDVSLIFYSDMHVFKIETFYYFQKSYRGSKRGGGCRVACEQICYMPYWSLQCPCSGSFFLLDTLLNMCLVGTLSNLGAGKICFSPKKKKKKLQMNHQ
jgi:hypothetical protein